MYSLEQVRIKILPKEIKYKGKAGRFFQFLPNNQGLNEEYLYTHQPLSTNTIPVYSTSPVPIGKLDDDKEVNEAFHVLFCPAIIVARKGYAGRMFVVEKGKYIVHEDAYAIKAKKKYEGEIDLHWFCGHYSAEFSAHRTSYWGIGDFPRSLFKKMTVAIPLIEIQKKVATLYAKRDKMLKELEQMQDIVKQGISDAIKLVTHNGVDSKSQNTLTQPESLSRRKFA